MTESAQRSSRSDPRAVIMVNGPLTSKECGHGPFAIIVRVVEGRNLADRGRLGAVRYSVVSMPRIRRRAGTSATSSAWRIVTPPRLDRLARC